MESPSCWITNKAFIELENYNDRKFVNISFKAIAPPTDPIKDKIVRVFFNGQLVGSGITGEQIITKNVELLGKANIRIEVPDGVDKVRNDPRDFGIAIQNFEINECIPYKI